MKMALLSVDSPVVVENAFGLKCCVFGFCLLIVLEGRAHPLLKLLKRSFDVLQSI